jgi:hypothetical protein
MSDAYLLTFAARERSRPLPAAPGPTYVPVNLTTIRSLWTRGDAVEGTDEGQKSEPDGLKVGTLAMPAGTLCKWGARRDSNPRSST